ncbi:hypothetical protein K8I61_07570 [bacterium]|nr:hypothetical protein [bacterium]
MAIRGSSRPERVLFIGLAVAAAVFGTAAGALGATFNVDSVLDAVDANPGDGVCATAVNVCSLRAAIMEANALDHSSNTINVPAGTYNLSIAPSGETDANGDLDILVPLDLKGAGASLTVIDPQGASRAIQIKDPADEDFIVNILDVTIQNGDQSHGGGLANDGGFVQMYRVIVRDSFAFSQGGGIINTNDARLEMHDCEVRDNTTAARGGGIDNVGSSVLKLYRTTIAGNTANQGGGIRSIDGVLRLEDSTVSGNFAEFSGGGILQSGVTHLASSTIANNTADQDLGGGVRNLDGTVQAWNTIVATNATNTFGPGGHDCVGDFTADFATILGSGDGCNVLGGIFAMIGDDNDPIDPMIGSLGSNGGPTRTHNLLAGSPAIDAGTTAVPPDIFACNATDQRGVPRPLDGDVNGIPRCDIGSFEYPPPDDGDGVNGFLEDQAPNDGDGNGDGIPDKWQPHVASIPNDVTGETVTIEAPEGALLEDVDTMPNPSPGDMPPGAEFPVGFFTFTIVGVSPALVNVWMPAGVMVDAWFKYGPTPFDPFDHWYDFNFDGATGVFLTFPDHLTLRFVDGFRGDHDLAVNGEIFEPGGPSFVLPLPVDIKPGNAQNKINPTSNGTIDVALLSTESYDAPARTDAESLTFGHMGDEDSLVHEGNGDAKCKVKDANGDGLADLVCKFSVEDAAFVAGDTEGVLKGETTNGFAFQGSDTVQTVP